MTHLHFDLEKIRSAYQAALEVRASKAEQDAKTGPQEEMAKIVRIHTPALLEIEIAKYEAINAGISPNFEIAALGENIGIALGNRIAQLDDKDQARAVSIFFQQIEHYFSSVMRANENPEMPCEGIRIDFESMPGSRA